jgi:hypothetical protein
MASDQLMGNEQNEGICKEADISLAEFGRLNIAQQSLTVKKATFPIR